MPLLIALDTRIVLASARGERTLALEDFYTGYRQTVLALDEVVVRLLVALPAHGELLRVYKVSKRYDDDISAVCLAVRMHLEDGRVTGVRIGAGGVAATPARAHQAEAALAGRTWTEDAAQAGADALRQDTLIRGRAAYREVGENLPNFALYDQTGAVVQSARFRGKQIMLNFIYTRCPVATMCSAATMNMMETQRLANEAGAKNLELVSITLDPEYDTPGVLRDYASSREIDTSNFSFLTGPERAIKDLLTQFGVIAQFDGAIIKHTLSTLLINEDGRIVHRADGTVWEPKDFVAKMHRR